MPACFELQFVTKGKFVLERVGVQSQLIGELAFKANVEGGERSYVALVHYGEDNEWEVLQFHSDHIEKTIDELEKL